MLETKVQLAAALNRSEATIRRWLRRSDWPFGAGPWPDSLLPDMRDWASERQEDRSRPSRLESQLRAKLTAELIRKTERETKLMTGELVPWQPFVDDMVKRIHACKGELLNTARLLGMIEPYLREPQMTADADVAVRRWVKGICDKFSGQATTETT